MSVKPITIQACNTQTCSETRGNSSNQFVCSYSNGTMGKDCTHPSSHSSSALYWDGILIARSSYDCMGSVYANGHSYVRGGEFSSSSSSIDYPCPMTSYTYCYYVTRT